ncbi:MAG TPA: phosphoglucomutase/phosphomannomutase family protein [Anaerolineae bacterium]|nr:phosphoglucomutase/phosphomannomutase family protein [Anaerolineae bacterium]
MAESVIKFGTDGWRAIMNDTFIISNVQVVAQAIADYLVENGLRDKGIVIGYDTRFFAERFASECAAVMLGNNIPVYMPRRALPTPVTAYSIKVYNTAGAIMLTASHNPPEYNGIKFIPEYAGPASPEITGEIERLIKANLESNRLLKAPLEGHELLHEAEPFPRYTQHIANLIDFDKLREIKLKVVLDPMFGASQGLMDTLLAEVGCAVETIHNYRDPLFGGSYPDPSEKHLSELKNEVIRTKSDIGLALDGDADRFGAIDFNGTYITANQVLSLVAVHLLKNRGMRGSIVRTIATTHLLDEIARDNDTEVIETPVGFKYIAQVMMERPVVVGGEESGGLSIQGHIPEKDGLLADLLLAELVAYEERPLTEILDGIYHKYGRYYSKRLDIHYPSEKKGELLNNLVNRPPAAVAEDKVVEIRSVDGVKYILESGDWILARPSGTEPLIRVYIESKDERRFPSLEEYAHQIMA